MGDFFPFFFSLFPSHVPAPPSQHPAPVAKLSIVRARSLSRKLKIMAASKRIVVVGAGPVGSLAALPRRAARARCRHI